MKKVYSLAIGLLVVVSGCGSPVMDKNTIFEAIELGNTVGVKQYLASGADVNVRKDYYGAPLLELKAATPLFLAIATDNIEIMDLLIAGGADVNAKAEGDVTPLILSIFKKDKKMIELLLANGADVNAKLDGGITPLHCAYLEDNQEIIDLLIVNGADVNAKEENGLIPNQANMDIMDEAMHLLKKVAKDLLKSQDCNDH